MDKNIVLCVEKRNKDIIKIVATIHFAEVMLHRSIDLSLLSEVVKKVNNLKIGEKKGIVINNTIFFYP